MSETIDIQRLMEKDPTEFNKMFDLWYRKLCLFAQSIVLDNDKAGNIVIESLHAFWKSDDTFTKPIQVQTYLCNNIINSSIDYLRKKELKSNLEKESLEKIENSESEIERKFMAAELIDMLYELIKKLPDKMKQVFIMTYLEGHSKSEVAKTLNLSEDIIRDTDAAAMKILRLNFKLELIKESKIL